MGCGDWSVAFNKRQHNTNSAGIWKQVRDRIFFAKYIQTQTKGNPDVDQLSRVDHVPTNAHSSQGDSQLYIFEDNEAVIKMILKGRSPTMRHVSRTHRVAFDWWFDSINLDPKIQIKNVDAKNQLADMLTQESFTRDEWNHLCTCWISWISRHSLAAICFFQTESRVSCQRDVKKALLMKGHRWRNRDRRVSCLIIACWVRERMLHKTWLIPETGRAPERNKAVSQQTRNTSERPILRSQVRPLESTQDVNEERRKYFSNSASIWEQMRSTEQPQMCVKSWVEVQSRKKTTLVSRHKISVHDYWKAWTHRKWIRWLGNQGNLRHPIAKGLQDIGSLTPTIQCKRVCEEAGIYHREKKDMHYKTIPDVDDGFVETIPMCREYTHLRSDGKSMCFAVIPGETVIGPVIDARVMKLVDKYGIEIEIPSPTRQSNFWDLPRNQGVREWVAWVRQENEMIIAGQRKRWRIFAQNKAKLTVTSQNKKE